MKLIAAIVLIYSTHCQVSSQIIFPDDSLYQNKYTSTVTKTVPSRSPTERNAYEEQYPSTRTHQPNKFSTVTNTLNNFQRGTQDYDKYVEHLVSTGVSKLAVAINKFSLYQKGTDNVIFSPVSIASALALVLLASNGKTFDELASVMGLAVGADIRSNSQIVHESLGKLFVKLQRTSDISEQIKVAAAIFVQDNYPIRNLYRQTSENIYHSEILNVDFRRNSAKTQHVINAWVSDRTNGKIKSILADPPPEETKVIITSALYFNGAWEKQFWDGFTKARPFYPNGRKTPTNINVEMMSNGGLFPFYKDTRLNCEIMGFPYKGNHTTMYVIIPQDSNVERLKLFEAALTADDVTRLVENTRYTQSVVLFPKMQFEASSNLNAPLQNLGVKSLFNPYEANLALLSPGIDDNHHNTKAYHDEVYKSSPNPLVPPASVPSSRDFSDVLIFSRFGSPLNCTQIFNPNSNISECEEIDKTTQKQVTYKKFGDKLGRRVTRETADTLDNLRILLNKDPDNKNVENPGLYADQVLHKVYIDITESGTEAAASTSISLTRGGDIAIFRADIPFLFFIWHEETKLILFWGTVYEPVPNHKNS